MLHIIRKMLAQYLSKLKKNVWVFTMPYINDHHLKVESIINKMCKIILKGEYTTVYYTCITYIVISLTILISISIDTVIPYLLFLFICEADNF